MIRHNDVAYNPVSHDVVTLDVNRDFSKSYCELDLISAALSRPVLVTEQRLVIGPNWEPSSGEHEAFSKLTIITDVSRVLTTESAFQLSVESNSAIALVLHYYALWLVKKFRATSSTVIYRNLLARVFPRLARATCIWFELWLAHWIVYDCCDWSE